MSNLNVFNQSWNEIVFEGRNKEYGAFQLRQENPRTTLKALFFGTMIVASLVSIPLISNLLKGEVAGVVPETYELPKVVPVIFEKLPEVKPEEKAAEAQPEKSSAKETKFVNTTITDKPTTTTELPVLDLDKPIKTGAVDNAGDNQGAVTLGQGALDGTGKKPVDKINDNADSGGGNIVNNIGLDSSPEFPGGLKRFSEAFVSKFKTPDLSEAMTMKIFVSFVVETDGSLSNIKVARDPGYGLGNEAIRALKAIKTKWKPGIQNGKAVRVSYNLPISVVLKS